MTTETTNHAPLLSQRDVLDGGTLYWRVAAVDADANVGDFSPVSSSASTRRCGCGRSVPPFAGGAGAADRHRDDEPRSDPRRAVRIWGAGLKARTVKTKANGRVVVKLKPKKKGIIYFRGTKAGFKTATTKVTVRVVRIGH